MWNSWCLRLPSHCHDEVTRIRIYFLLNVTRISVCQDKQTRPFLYLILSHFNIWSFRPWHEFVWHFDCWFVLPKSSQFSANIRIYLYYCHVIHTHPQQVIRSAQQCSNRGELKLKVRCPPGRNALHSLAASTFTVSFNTLSHFTSMFLFVVMHVLWSCS